MNHEALYKFTAKSVGGARYNDSLILTNSSVKPDVLWNAWLNAHPVEQRQEFNCGACRQWFEKYSTLLLLERNNHGEYDLKPLAWRASLDDLSESEIEVVLTMRRLLRESVPGAPIQHRPQLLLDRKPGAEGTFKHFSAGPITQVTQFKTADHFRMDYARLAKFINEVSLDSLKEVQRLFQLDPTVNGFYRLAEPLPKLIQFKTELEAAPTQAMRKAVIAWYTNYSYLVGTINTVLGQFVTNYHSEGVDYAKGLFKTMVDPSTYCKPEALPSEIQKAIAEDKIRELGLQDSLLFDLAQANDPSIQWLMKYESPVAEPATQSVFGGVKTKDAPATKAVEDTYVGKLSWGVAWPRFLATAKRVELQVPHKPIVCGMLVAAVNREAPTVMKHTKANPEIQTATLFFQQAVHPIDLGLTMGEFIPVLGIVRTQEDVMKPENENEPWMFVIEGGNWSPACNIPNPLPLPSLIPELRDIERMIYHFGKGRDVAGKAGNAALLPIARALGKQAYNPDTEYRVQLADESWVRFHLLVA